MLITQGTIQGQPRQLTFIVIHDSNRIIERIACRNGAADSILKIFQFCADGDFLRIHTGLNQKNLHFSVLGKLLLTHGFEIDTDKIRGIENVVLIIPRFRDDFLCFFL